MYGRSSINKVSSEEGRDYEEHDWYKRRACVLAATGYLLFNALFSLACLTALILLAEILTSVFWCTLSEMENDD